MPPVLLPEQVLCEGVEVNFFASSEPVSKEQSDINDPAEFHNIDKCAVGGAYVPVPDPSAVPSVTVFSLEVYAVASADDPVPVPAAAVAPIPSVSAASCCDSAYSDCCTFHFILKQ